MTRIGSLCSGYGGLEMAAHTVLGGEVAWVADIDPGAAKILAHRYPYAPNLGDIANVEWDADDPVDILTAGFPCQDVSCAGARRGLRDGTRSGVWSHVAYAIGVLEPSLVLLENVGGLLSAGADSNMEFCPWCLGEAGDEHALRACGAVLGDLADIGFDAEWTVVSAEDAGACHRRKRVFILAWPATYPQSGMARGWGDAGILAGEERHYRRTPGEGSQRDTTGNCYPVAEDADGTTRDQRRLAASGQAEGGRSRADAGGSGGARTADAEGDGRDEGRPESAGVVRGPDAAIGGYEVARCPSCGCGEDWHDAGGFCAGPCGGNCADPVLGRPDGGWNDFEDDADPADVIRYARHYSALADARSTRLGEHSGESSPQEAGPFPGDEPSGDHRSRPIADWGPYGPAIARWEAVTGRPAPRPTEPGRTGERLSPRFVEWLMGLPEGWVTDVPGLSRNAQLKALGNGVVPQQAALALRLLLERAGIATEAGEAA